LDAQRVGRVVGGQFPDLGGLPVRMLGEGWDHDLYVIGDDEWVFRFPKRAERVPWLLREVAILDLVVPTLGDLVPRFEHLGAPSRDFPYPFVGYRFVHGHGADRLDPVPAAIAGEIGSALARLHAIDPRDVPPTPARWEDEPPVSSRTSGLERLPEPVLARLTEPARRTATSHASGAVPAPPAPDPGSRRLCHNDIGAEHLVVDPARGRLAGVLDWTDAMVTDPVVDFAGLITVGGYELIEAVVSAYGDLCGPELDGGFWDRLVWWCRELALTWLFEAIEEHPHHLDRPLAWVERAFGEPERG
jgi:aminoglycoside phosphotransferase (APT) family kinase protein